VDHDGHRPELDDQVRRIGRGIGSMSFVLRHLSFPRQSASLDSRDIGAMARPLGEVHHALLAAAAARPGTVQELAQRACVGRRAACYTASRMIARGVLRPVAPGRPAVLAVVVGESADDMKSTMTARESTADLFAQLADFTRPPP
jgi:hypothetical protein